MRKDGNERSRESVVPTSMSFIATLILCVFGRRTYLKAGVLLPGLPMCSWHLGMCSHSVNICWMNK